MSAAEPSVSGAEAATASEDDVNFFMEVYDCAKNNYQWPKVSAAINDHPTWLTRIPPGSFS